MAVQTMLSGGLRRRVLAAALGIGAVLAAQGAMGAPVRAATGQPVISTHPMIPAVVPSGPVNSSVTSISTTDNWSGYYVNSPNAGAFTAVTGCWDVPSVSPSAVVPAYSSAWVGIDGTQNKDLIQTGTEQDWSSSTGQAPFAADYFAWWEILPAQATQITTISVTPGDDMCASIGEIGASGQWTISLTDETSGRTFSTVQGYAGPADSAEWIVEAPFATDGSYSCGPCTLANYGQTTFSQLSEDGLDPELTPVNGLEMVQPPGTVVSIPSNPDSDGNGFNLAYGSAQPAPPTDTPGGGYTLDAYGGLHPYGDAPYEAVSADYPGWSIVVGVVLNACDSSGHSGWTVDGYGGMHQFGAAPYVSVYGGYYPGWDIIRGAVAYCAQGHAVGYTVDAYGGMHPFSDDPGGVEPPYPQITGYWPGRELTAGIALIPGTDEGYVVDAYGGLHPFNGAPYYGVSAYYPGFNIIRGLTLLPGGGGGYTVDAYGGLHPFGSAPYEPVSGYYPGWDIIRGVVASSATGGYAVDAFGGLHPYGTAPYRGVTGDYPGRYIIEGVVFSAT
jgi:hypothetical protein